MKELMRTHESFAAKREKGAELKSLSNQQARGKVQMTKAQKAEWDDYMQQQDQFVIKLKGIMEMMQKDDSVSSYPGLLALGEITYDAQSRIYLLRIFTGYHHYEDSQGLYPYYHRVSFDLHGRILDQKKEGSMVGS